MKLELPDDEDSLWAALPSERRNRVRRARKEGLSVEIGDAAMLDTFYDIWSRNMRDLGSPPHSRAFFKCILEEFPESSRLIFVMHEGNTIGAALAMVWNGVMSVPWVSSLRKYFGLYPNNILYWEALRLAVSMGCSTFDFGRSTVDSGTYQFKLRWGAVPTALNWQFFAVNDSPIPQSTGSEGFGLAIEIWKRLPLFLTNAVGPSIRKNITA
jgi:FemAB-related protein (PEP-CTERM system-associated)